MLVLQDFEALTPNLLARTVETVEGGGCIVLLLSTLESLSQLYSLTMDVHSRLRTESHQEVKGGWVRGRVGGGNGEAWSERGGVLASEPNAPSGTRSLAGNAAHGRCHMGITLRPLLYNIV